MARPATKTASATTLSIAEVGPLLAAAPTPLAKLRVPFADEHIELRPQPKAKADNNLPKSGCRPGTQASADGLYCGGWHVPSIHLSFVGHAALTERLLEADEHWTWEPMARDEFGAPKLDQFGGLWINLIIDGVSRPGYGDAGDKGPSSTAVKEIIGDALRNAGMRFGMALQLWSKVDLSLGKDARGEYDTPPADPVVATGRRGASKAIEAAPEPVADTGIDNPDFDDDTTGAMPQKKTWPPFGVDLESRFILSATEAKTAEDVRVIWRAANNEFGASPTPGQEGILNALADLGMDLDLEEKKAAAPKTAPAAEAQSAMKRGFEG